MSKFFSGGDKKLLYSNLVMFPTRSLEYERRQDHNSASQAVAVQPAGMETFVLWAWSTDES